jgi:hypothetical protein
VSWLDDMAAAGLPITWGTLLVGWEGPGKHGRLVDADEVFAFAEPLMETLPAETVAALADRDELPRTLRELAAGADRARELRKWRWVMLRRALEELPKEPMYALLALTDFWERFDYPADSPHVVQGRGNQLSPAEYFTDENYRRIVDAHQRWLHDEAAQLTQSK